MLAEPKIFFYFLILFLFLNPYGPTCGRCCSPLHVTLSLSEAASSYLTQGYLRHLAFSSRETRSSRHYKPKSQNKNMLPNVSGRNRAVWFLIPLFPEDVSLSSWSVWYLLRGTQREPQLQRCARVRCMHDSSITDGSSGAALCSENQSVLLKVNNNCKNSGGTKA